MSLRARLWRLEGQVGWLKAWGPVRSLEFQLKLNDMKQRLIDRYPELAAEAGWIPAPPKPAPTPPPPPPKPPPAAKSEAPPHPEGEVLAQLAPRAPPPETTQQPPQPPPREPPQEPVVQPFVPIQAGLVRWRLRGAQDVYDDE